MKILPVLLSLLLTACATTLAHEPSGPQDTLVVGEVSLHAENFPRYGSATVEGNHTAGIHVTFREVGTSNSFVVTSVGERGLFSFPAVVGGEYRITKFEYTNQSGGYTAVLIGTPPLNRLRFTVGSEGVCSLGSVVWSADDKLRYYATTSTDRGQDVKSDLLKQYPKTQWVNYPWTPATWFN